MERLEMTITDALAHRPSRARNVFRRILARAAGDTGGVAAIEFSIIVPMLVLMVVALIDCTSILVRPLFAQKRI
jgi:Flp pilus assembly protein TadG